MAPSAPPAPPPLEPRPLPLGASAPSIWLRLAAGHRVKAASAFITTCDNCDRFARRCSLLYVDLYIDVPPYLKLVIN